jgi:hypothetical protein
VPALARRTRHQLLPEMEIADHEDVRERRHDDCLHSLQPEQTRVTP